MTTAELKQFAEDATTRSESPSRTSTLAGSILTPGYPEHTPSLFTTGTGVVLLVQSYAGELGTLTSVGPATHAVAKAHSLWVAPALSSDPMLREALSRASTQPAPIAVNRAQKVLSVAQSIRRPDRAAVSRSGVIAISFFQGRRYGIFECDEDGDVVLTLTDRDDEAEAETYLVEQGQESTYVQKASHFVSG